MLNLLVAELVILARARRTCRTLLIGMIGFMLLMFVGPALVSGLEFQGILAPVGETIQATMILGCAYGAWLWLLRSLVDAACGYSKERARIERMF